MRVSLSRAVSAMAAISTALGAVVYYEPLTAYVPLSVITDPNQAKASKPESSSWWYSLFGAWGRSGQAQAEIPAIPSPTAVLSGPRAFAQPAAPTPMSRSGYTLPALLKLIRDSAGMSEADVTKIIVDLSGPMRQYLLQALISYEKILKTIDPKSIANVIRGPLSNLRKKLEEILVQPTPSPGSSSRP